MNQAPLSRTVRERIIAVEVMKLERRQARERAADHQRLRRVKGAAVPCRHGSS
jgi:hypothetical protein